MWMSGGTTKDTVILGNSMNCDKLLVAELFK